jgi:spore germination cell wall hydrolase CwlJ-like protein
MTEVMLLAQLMFSEALKKSGKDEDAISVGHVVLNRMKRPARFGRSLEEVIYSPSQFSGVNSNEWNKVSSGKLNEEEQEIYKRYLQLASGILRGDIADPTNGADHYYNPKLVNPSWAKDMDKMSSTEGHVYLKEKILQKKTKNKPQ